MRHFWVVLLIWGCWAYDVHEDEYFNDYLPGGPDDPVGRPNVPLTIDTNRFSDGVSSTSYYSLSSPHFPDYTGPLSSDNNYNREHYLELVDSAAKQGVALRGAGKKEVLDAKTKILDTINLNDTYNPNITFIIDAAKRWNPSGFPIQSGERYAILLSGTQVWQDGDVRVGANGYRSYYDARTGCHVGLGRCKATLKYRRRLESANWFSLVCGIGNYVQKLSNVISEYARFMPMEEEQILETFFQVNPGSEFEAIYTGELMCFANDADTLYHDNSGYIEASIVRLSWPPVA